MSIDSPHGGAAETRRPSDVAKAFRHDQLERTWSALDEVKGLIDQEMYSSNWINPHSVKAVEDIIAVGLQPLSGRK